MFLTYLFWASVIAAATAIAVSVYYLTTDSLKSTVIENIPDAQIAQITDVIKTTQSTTSPTTVKINVKCRSGNDKNMEITAQKSDYFYKNQKIYIR